MVASDKIARTVVWRRIMDDKSFELATVSRVHDLYRITGLAILAESETPMRVDYKIDCNGAWETRSVQIREIFGAQIQELTLAAEDRIWRRNGALAPELDGCTDVDLGISPSTNLLPINRLAIPVGEKREIRAAWVQFPQCDVVPAPQSYERVDTFLYRYRSLSSGFTALLKVDDVGLPLDYEGIWQAIAQVPGTNVVDAFELR